MYARNLSSFPAIDLADIEKAARRALKLDAERTALRGTESRNAFMMGRFTDSGCEFEL